MPRRPSSLLFVVAALAGLTALAGPPRQVMAAPASPAPMMFRADAAHTGIYAEPAPRRLKGVRFAFRAGAPIRSTPALADGTLYFGDASGAFYAIDARTGAQRWRVQADSGITGSPTVMGGTAYVTTRGGGLYALSTANGKTRWRFAFGKDLGEENYWEFYTSSPTAYAGALYVGGGDGKVYAIEARSGRVLWKTDVGSRVRSTPAVSEELVVFGTQSGHVRALDRRTGAPRWSYATEGADRPYEAKNNDTRSVYTTPSIIGGTVVFGARDGLLYAVDLKTGAERWRKTHAGGSWVLSTAGEGDTVYSGSGSAYFVQSAELATGAERWRHPTRAAVFGGLAVAGNVLLYNDFSGDLEALDKTTGARLWRFALGARTFAAPLIGDGAVFAASDLGVLYALDVDAAASPPAPKRLVYGRTTPTKDGFAWFADDIGASTLGYFRGAGYEAVDAEQLRAAMQDQIAGKSRSLVVFADNMIPSTVFDTEDDRALIRRFLDAGGRVAFLGAMPLSVRVDVRTGEPSNPAPDVPGRVLGLDLIPRKFDFGPHLSQATADGLNWGLDRWSVTNGAVRPDGAMTVLARDEFGAASTWVKRYPNGGMLIQLSVPRSEVTTLAPFRNAIEHEP